jgi:T1SS-143 domain-containing protein
VYTVSLTGGNTGATVTANLNFGEGSAAAGTDYVTKFYSDAELQNEITSVTLGGDGATSVNVYVSTIDNDPPFAEANETVVVTLSNIQNASAGDTTGSGTIEDHTPEPIPPVAQNVSAEGDDNAAIPITLSGTDSDGTVVSITLTGSLPGNGTLYADEALTTQVTAGQTFTGSSVTLYFDPAPIDSIQGGGPGLGTLALTAADDITHDETADVQTDGNKDDIAAPTDEGLLAVFGAIESTPIGWARVDDGASITGQPDGSGWSPGQDNTPSFTYTVTDDDGLSDTTDATVNITVNDVPPSDGNASYTVNALTLTDSAGSTFDGDATGVQVTGGDAIFLFTEGDLVVGREGGAEGDVAFALYIDSDGVVTMAQYLAIDHGDGSGNESTPTGDDEVIDLTDLVYVNADITVTGPNGATNDFDLRDELTVAFNDDGPVAGGEGNDVPTVSAAVTEDGLSTLTESSDESEGNRSVTQTTDDDEAASGENGVQSLATLVNFGTDQAGKFGLLDTQDALDTLPTLYSDGEALSYDVSYEGDASILEASAGDRVVFTLTVNADGSWSFDLDDQLDHVDASGDDSTMLFTGEGNDPVSAINFTQVLSVVDGDGDPLDLGTVASDAFTVSVENDVPVIAGDEQEPVKVSAGVHEDGMSTATGNAADGDQSEGNRSGGQTTSSDQAASGDDTPSLATLVKMGADEPGTFKLLDTQDALDTLPTLYSNGDAVTYAVTYEGDDSILTATADGRTVFTLRVESDGDWSFDLDDQLDHVNDDSEVTGVGDTELALFTGDESDPVSAINFTQLLSIEDADGDALDLSALADDAFTVTVENDVPVRNGSLDEIVATVREDGMSVADGDEDDLSTGNQTVVDLSQDEASGEAGSLTALFKVGADEEARISLSTDEDALDGLPKLLSKGEEVTYSVNEAGDTLTATAGGRTVFTLEVNEDGSWSFDLDDQLDHVANGGENMALRTDGSPVSSIDFSSLIVVTDADGDSLGNLLQAGDFVVKVVDDIPVRNEDLEPITPTVREDGMNAAVDESPAGSAGNDLSTGVKPEGGTDTDDEASSTLSGSLADMFKVGADEPASKISLSSTDTSTLPTLWSKGEAVSYSVNGSGDTLTATAGGRTVFTLKVNADGSWAFDLDDQLDHVDGDGENDALRTSAPGDPVTSVGSIDFSQMIVVTDADGDALKNLLDDGDFAITLVDDAPTLAVSNIVAPNIAGTYEGEYAFNVGADEQSFAASFDADTSLVWTNPVDGFDFNLVSSSTTTRVYEAKATDAAPTDPAFFRITVNNDGTYDFQLITAKPIEEVPSGEILSTIAGGSNQPSFTIPASTFDDFFSVVITGHSDEGPGLVTISNVELGVNGNSVQEQAGEYVRFDIQQAAGFEDVTLSSFTAQIAETGSIAEGDTFSLRVVYEDAPTATINGTLGADHKVTFDINENFTVDYVEFVPTENNVTLKISGVELSYVVEQFPDDFDLNFSLTGSDADGDSAQANFAVSVKTSDTDDNFVITGTAGSDHLYGSDTDDVLTGLTGNDILTGGDGSDRFVFDNIGELDSVTDFSVAGGDKLDITAVLSNTDSSHILLVEADGNTTVMVNTAGTGDGNPSSYTPLVTLQGVTGATLEQLLTQTNP